MCFSGLFRQWQYLHRRTIRRHRLQKKDPSAAISDPVKPIQYWVDSGAPDDVKQALLEGARWWNQAFEAAGFTNAFKVDVLPADADPKTADPVALVSAFVGQPIEMDVLVANPWVPHLVVAKHYQKGRVFLAGDAAHQVSPFGARGANTGVQDCDNLSWKLQAVLAGDAPEALLDSYHEKRAYAADDNLGHSTRATDFITPKSRSSTRLRNAVLFNRRNGEIALSRNVGAVIKPVNAAVIVTGTYGTSYTTVYVSLKMVSVADGRILAGADFVVPRGAELDGLIRRRTAGY